MQVQTTATVADNSHTIKRPGPVESHKAVPPAADAPTKDKADRDWLDNDTVVKAIDRAQTFFQFDATQNALEIPQCSRVTEHGKDCAITLSGHVGRQLVESVYARHAPAYLAGKCIGIHCYSPYVDGIGDILSLSKMARVLQSTGARVVLLDPDPKNMLRYTYFSFIERDDVILIDRQTGKDPLEGIDAVIMARGTDVGPRYGCFYRGASSKLRVPLLNVLEYNVHAVLLGPDVIETGFSYHSVGFFRDAQMQELARLDAPARTGRKQQIYDSLRLSEDYAFATGTGVWPAVKPDTIHTSYCKWDLSKIIDVSAHVHSEQDGDLTLHVVSKPHWNRQVSDLRDNLKVPPAGYALLRLDVPGLHTSLRAAEASLATGPQKTMTVRGFSRLPPEKFSVLVQLSDFMFVTGDQSVSEAISLGIPYAYQCCMHKYDLMMALKEAPELSPEARTWHEWLLGGCRRPYPKHFTSSVQQELSDRSMRLARQCDLSEHFLARVMQRVADHDFDDLRRYQMHVDREVERLDLTKVSPDGLKRLRCHLRELSEGIQEQCNAL